MQTDLRLELRSDPRLLGAMRGLVRAYFSTAGLNRDRCDEVVLAVDEACTNAMRHAYGGDHTQTVYLTFRADEEAIELELLDKGCPAPYEKVQAREVKPPSLEDLTPGGLGVQLIYTVFDEARFEPGAEQGNRVLMRLRLKKKGTSTPKRG